MAGRFAIGVDLGTTNSVLAFCPLDDDAPPVQVLRVPQLVAAQTVEPRTQLPSFLYLAHPEEAKGGAFALPWSRDYDFVVGQFAQRQAADSPQRTVAAAKSWLCHSQVDRRQAILPWQAPDEVPKISPLTASQRYLEHLVSAWRHQHPDAPFDAQRVVLTVPASFDPVARELTREAALAAGFPTDLVLLEEPQAALYAWLLQMGDRWRKTLHPGDTLLVCDVGGGTTDLTLVSAREENGQLGLGRLAVGNHLLVGGDNMDLALAHFAAERLNEKGAQLDAWQSVSLWHACRAAKETLLSKDGPSSHTVSVVGRGRALLRSAVSLELSREDVAGLLIDGFFPRVPLDDAPQRRRASGFRELGLAYESDTAITRHLAAFLRAHGSGGQAASPTHLLLNGGVFESAALRERLLAVLGEWFPDRPPQLLSGTPDLAHAVALGGAHYALARERGGLRIRGGASRAYYIGIESSGPAIPGAARPLRALCVAPLGMEEGTSCDVPSADIGLIVGEAAQFRFFSSPTRKQDRPGDLLTRWSEGELEETDSLEAVLPLDPARPDEYVPVRFQAVVTELGMLELWCKSTHSDQRWKLSFSVRRE